MAAPHRAGPGTAPGPAPERAPRAVPPEVLALAAGLRRLTDLLAPAEGWYGAFLARDPEGLRDCLTGRDVPPWDVIAALLEDVELRHGEETRRLAEADLLGRYAAGVAAHDDAPDGESALHDRLEAVRVARGDAERRVSALAAAVRRSPGDTGLRTELAWARDYRDRTAARSDALRERLAALHTRTAVRAAAASAEAAAARKRRSRPRGSRFAGLDEDPGAAPEPSAAVVPPGAAAPSPPAR
ncbi:hypothetical protein HOY81_24030, partial [Streptomyces sp. JJ36]|nr:hypothetical protein [Streptomyces sp. JJ36]